MKNWKNKFFNLDIINALIFFYLKSFIFLAPFPLAGEEAKISKSMLHIKSYRQKHRRDIRTRAIKWRWMRCATDAFIFRGCKRQTHVLHELPIQEREKENEEERKENARNTGNIVSAHKSIATRIISTRVHAIDKKKSILPLDPVALKLISLIARVRND